MRLCTQEKVKFRYDFLLTSVVTDSYKVPATIRRGEQTGRPAASGPLGRLRGNMHNHHHMSYHFARCYNEGLRAYNRGIKDCPYSKYTERAQYEAWVDGLCAAQKQAQVADQEAIHRACRLIRRNGGFSEYR
jgi:hypothetical protein